MGYKKMMWCPPRLHTVVWCPPDQTRIWRHEESLLSQCPHQWKPQSLISKLFSVLLLDFLNRDKINVVFKSECNRKIFYLIFDTFHQLWISIELWPLFSYPPEEQLYWQRCHWFHLQDSPLCWSETAEHRWSLQVFSWQQLHSLPLFDFVT